MTARDGSRFASRNKGDVHAHLSERANFPPKENVGLAWEFGDQISQPQVSRGLHVEFASVRCFWTRIGYLRGATSDGNADFSLVGNEMILP